MRGYVPGRAAWHPRACLAGQTTANTPVPRRESLRAQATPRAKARTLLAVLSAPMTTIAHRAVRRWPCHATSATAGIGGQQSLSVGCAAKRRTCARLTQTSGKCTFIARDSDRLSKIDLFQNAASAQRGLLFAAALCFSSARQAAVGNSQRVKCGKPIAGRIPSFATRTNSRAGRVADRWAGLRSWTPDWFRAAWGPCRHR